MRENAPRAWLGAAARSGRWHRMLTQPPAALIEQRIEDFLEAIGPSRETS